MLSSDYGRHDCASVDVDDAGAGGVRVSAAAGERAHSLQDDLHTRINILNTQCNIHYIDIKRPNKLRRYDNHTYTYKYTNLHTYTQIYYTQIFTRTCIFLLDPRLEQVGRFDGAAAVCCATFALKHRHVLTTERSVFHRDGFALGDIAARNLNNNNNNKKKMTSECGSEKHNINKCKGTGMGMGMKLWNFKKVKCT